MTSEPRSDKPESRAADERLLLSAERAILPRLRRRTVRRTTSRRAPLDAFLTSTLAVAIAEIGDKTQLLALCLACRYAARGAIVAGIAVATVANHALSAWLGVWIASILPPGWLPWLVGTSFLALGVWLLFPDKDAPPDGVLLERGAFAATTALFFLAEIGDKTQVATVVLAAHYIQPVTVIAGSTLGMLAANAPVVFAGRWLMSRMPLGWARGLAFALFLGFGGAAVMI